MSVLGSVGLHHSTAGNSGKYSGPTWLYYLDLFWVDFLLDILHYSRSTLFFFKLLRVFLFKASEKVSIMDRTHDHKHHFVRFPD